MSQQPLAYFITFRTYGTWLPGDRRGFVDLAHNAFGEPPLDANRRRELWAESKLVNPPVRLDDGMRCVAASAIEEVCQFRGWQLVAANVRTNHVHVVLAAQLAPERVLADLRSRITRRLTVAGLIPRGSKVWSGHGSTRYLWHEDDVSSAVHYVRDLQ